VYINFNIIAILVQLLLTSFLVFLEDVQYVPAIGGHKVRSLRLHWTVGNVHTQQRTGVLPNNKTAFINALLLAKLHA